MIDLSPSMDRFFIKNSSFDPFQGTKLHIFFCNLDKFDNIFLGNNKKNTTFASQLTGIRSLYRIRTERLMRRVISDKQEL